MDFSLFIDALDNSENNIDTIFVSPDVQDALLMNDSFSFTTAPKSAEIGKLFGMSVIVRWKLPSGEVHAIDSTHDGWPKPDDYRNS